ncbi:hypothetical protein UCD39_03230 [Nitrospirillum sp. BR 11752]|uniref:hypothetical protein n=1 Tax=Nitrospirillum sp. BR 11752 TaxID=3104293 RepID=UPI002EAB0C75|nr:hypothetical protein [Nitrospirillum sp. BR 11752]
MPQYALYGNERLVAADADDQKVLERFRRLSKDRDFRMRCCPHIRAQFVKRENGTVFFRHFGGVGHNCSGSKVSEEHERLKVAAYRVAKIHGRLAEFEVSGPGWRADVLMTNPKTGRRTAIEIQRSDQTIDETRDRVTTHTSSDVTSMWFFLKEENYKEVPTDLKNAGLPAFLLSGDSAEDREILLKEILGNILTGKLVFDDGAPLEGADLEIVGYDYPCVCGEEWFRTSYAVVYPNRIRGDQLVYAKPIGSLPGAQRYIEMCGQVLARKTGIIRKSSLGTMELCCPSCSHSYGDEFLTSEQAIVCPETIKVGAYDARADIHDFRPQWRSPSPPSYREQTWEAERWKNLIGQGRFRILEDRRTRREQEIRRIQAEEEQRHRIEEEKRLYKEREIAEIFSREFARLRTYVQDAMSEDEFNSWITRPIALLDGRSPEVCLKEHASAVWNTAGYANSAVTKYVIEVREGGQHFLAAALGMENFHFRAIRRKRIKGLQENSIQNSEGVAQYIGRSLAMIATDFKNYLLDCLFYR